MKTVLMALVTMMSVSAHAAINMTCVSTGSIDRISEIEVTSTETAGQIEVKTTKVLPTGVLGTDSSTVKGSIYDSKILVSTQDKGPFGTDRVVLETTAKGYELVKYNQCNFYYQEETCSSQEDEQTSEVSRESNLRCFSRR